MERPFLIKKALIKADYKHIIKYLLEKSKVKLSSEVSPKKTKNATNT